MDYIEICKWNTYQHYKHRNPPWVKLYSWFLDDDDFDCMPDASKLLFFCLLSFASRRNNKVRHNLKWLQKKLPIEATLTEEVLQPLIDAKFIRCYRDASTEIAESEQDAMPEIEIEKIKTEREVSVFKVAHSIFPSSKNGVEIEFDNFCKVHSNWVDILPLLEIAIQNQIEWRKVDGRYWKCFKNWLEQSCWTELSPKDIYVDDGLNHCQHPGCKKYWSKDDPKKLCKEHDSKK